jgi:hypothetical protein
MCLDKGIRVFRVLLRGHDLNLGALAVEIIELELGAASANVVYATGEALDDAVHLDSGWNLAFCSVGVDVELVGMGWGFGSS